jgi:hypothetical protein
MCGGNAECVAGADYYGTDSEYYSAEEEYYENDDGGDDGNRSYISPGSDSLNHQTATANAKYMPYFIIGAVLTTLTMAMVWRKRVSRFPR